MNMISREQHYLLDSVVKWFNKPDQVDHYVDEIPQGPTPAEKALLEQLPPPCSVLDAGCGAGRISVWLAQQGYKVTGVDVSLALIEQARLALPDRVQVDYRHLSTFHYPFPDNSFDAIICFKVLCYIPTKELRNQYLDHLYRMLNPGGTCLLTQYIVPEDCIGDAVDEDYMNSPASKFQIIERGDCFPLSEGYVRWFTESDLEEELRDSPFRIAFNLSDEHHGGSGFMRLIILEKQV
ncbi:class I SAM-dependent methyltransferase [Paenibacillus spongiae]|uniref:Methyltransferase domain-containing protein n=1 Tax=Paenibacillus spongiae TaxID=2909671 RepID=A0ABY5S2C9_9BACL|nr:class I SAM-dependent methyltransferase [Paenibacillus spongiae]UVI28026.1 methyltransferase domain-containing protein [Paenibacillus spongiae]